MTLMERAPAVDGRTQRREKNRAAVVEALLGLYSEGSLFPSADEIAQRAGISARSLFRYFEDVDDLVRASIARQQERLLPLWELDVTSAEPLAERIDGFVAARVRLLEGMGEVGRVARRRAPHKEPLAAELRRVRSALRDQLESVFGPELDELGAERATVFAALDVITSWESYDLLRNDQGLDGGSTIAALKVAVRALLKAAR